MKMEQPPTSEIEQPSMDYKHFDDIIELIWSGEKATELKKEVRKPRGGGAETQELLLKIETAERKIEENPDDKEYIKELDFEIKCLIREIEGKPAEGTTEEEKEEYRKFYPNTLTEEQVEKLKQKIKDIEVS